VAVALNKEFEKREEAMMERMESLIRESETHRNVIEDWRQEEAEKHKHGMFHMPHPFSHDKKEGDNKKASNSKTEGNKGNDKGAAGGAETASSGSRSSSISGGPGPGAGNKLNEVGGDSKSDSKRKSKAKAKA
jgi:hypothetical protein